jgi:tetratricopeptide (TPR) repeat protein
LRAQIYHLASFDTLGNPEVPTLLLQGETGTGKGLVARVVHASGPRAQGPFIEVNCAAVPEALLEAELFGFEAGAFTDAKRAKRGLLEAASGGTLFLNEIESLPLALQGKFLTAIEEKRVRRLGAVAEQAVDVKLIVAAQEALGGLVSAGRFRADLYHRLAVVLLELPPLHERGADVVLLARHFLRHYATAHGLLPRQLSGAAEAWLQGYCWPGNVRELSHLMERVTLLSPEDLLTPALLERFCLPQPAPALQVALAPARGAGEPLDEPTRIQQALRQTRDNVVQAARLLGLSRSALRHRMRRYGIERPHREELAQHAPPGEAEAHRNSPTRKKPPTPAPDWEQKPVAVLAIALTFPKDMGGKAVRYDSWTVVAHWEHMIDEKIRGFGGTLIQRSPALLIAVFGLPHTLEHMPQRAVRAGLAIQYLATEAGGAHGEGPRPTVQLAIHLGGVLVDMRGSDPPTRLLAVGETLTLPVQMLGHARAGEVLVSPQVGRQVEEVCALQVRQLPITSELGNGAAYVVLGLRPWPVPEERMRRRSLSRFVGRERELVSLHEHLAQVEGGQGQVVGIVGELGMGKSRLLAEFCRSLREKQVAYLEGHCLSYSSTMPYQPVLDLLRQHCRVTNTDGPEVIIAKVSHTLQAVNMAPEEQAPYLLQLLGVHEATQGLAALTEESLQKRTFATLRQLFLKSSQRRPHVIAVDNLHWIDPTSEAFFGALVEHLAGAPILFLATYRPGYRLPAIDRSYVTQMALQPLSPRDSASVVQSICQQGQLRPSLLHDILATAEGNPLFLEELAQAAVEQSHRQLSLTVPDTIQGALMARMDRLPKATRRLLQTAAILGRSVSHWLLEALWDEPGDLYIHLQELHRLEFLYEQAEAEEAGYVFKHALTREVAYDSLPLLQRQALHAAAGRALEARYVGHPEPAMERLAYHYARSAETTKAVTYLTCCAEKAVRSYAHVEAVTVLQEALGYVVHLPAEDQERCRLELGLRQAFSLSLLGRYPDILALFLPQRDSVERLADPRLSGPYYFLLGLTYSALGEYDRGSQSAAHAVEAAQRCGDTTTMGEAYYVLSFAAYSSGRLQQGVEYGQQAVALLEQTTGQRWLSKVQFILALGYLHLGDFAAALASATWLESLGEATEDPRCQSFAALLIGWGYALQGEREAGIAAGQRSLACAPDPFSAALALGFLGHTYLEAGDQVQAIPLLQQASEQFCQFGYRLGEGRCAALLGEAYLLRGEVAQARDLAHRGLAISRDIQYEYGIGLARRALGRIAQASGALAEAETHLTEALQTFAAMPARFEVGRTHLALAELAYSQGNREALATHLAEAHHLFKTLRVPKYGKRAEQLATQHNILLPDG